MNLDELFHQLQQHTAACQKCTELFFCPDALTLMDACDRQIIQFPVPNIKEEQ